jgi:hypothetical protein
MTMPLDRTTYEKYRSSLRKPETTDIEIVRELFNKNNKESRASVQEEAWERSAGDIELWVYRVLDNIYGKHSNVTHIDSSQERHERNQAGPVQKPFYKP